MFSFHNWTDPFGSHQMPYRCPPRMADFGPQYFQSSYNNDCGPRRCRNPEFEQAMSNMCPAVLNFLANLGERYNPKADDESNSNNSEGHCRNQKDGKNDENLEKPCEGPKNKPETEGKDKAAKENNSFQCMLRDVFGNVVAVLDDARPAQKWRQKVDCRGFESKNIKVKIEDRALHLKAFRKENARDGMRTASMRKTVALPDYIDEKKITCQLLCNGILIVEAPIVNREGAPANNRKDFVKELMTMIFPGIKQTREDESGEKTLEKEKVDGKSNENAQNSEQSSYKSEEFSEIPKTTPVMDTEDKQNPSTTEEPEMVSQIAGETENLLNEPIDEKYKMQDADDKNEASSDDKIQQFQEHVIDDDAISNSSEDSFILLSELGKENNENRDSSSQNALSTSMREVVTDTDSPARNDDNDKVYQKDSTFENQQITNETNQENDGKEESSSDSIHEPQQSRKTRSDQGTIGGSVINEQPFSFHLEMPSYNPKSIQVNFDESKSVLNIMASKETPSSSGKTKSIAKSVTIPENVDVDCLQCTYRDGTLSVTAPFKKSRTNTVIPVMF